jgi:hypothetical protein
VLASLDDVNTWLPQDKLEADVADVDLFQEDADRVIKGYLSGVFSAVTLAGWADPGTTPVTIRAIAGRLVAAKFYKQRYAEDVVDIPEYAQQLYDEAMAMLMQVVSGSLVIDPAIQVPGQLGELDFLPNDDSEGPFFRMDLVF